MLLFLKVFLTTIWIGIIYIVVATSLESSLFKEWDFLASIPWMRATLWDFYANILVIYLWVIWRERNFAIRMLWAVLFFSLGSIASIGYVLIQLYPLKNLDDARALLQPKPITK
jgi:hypothetical protein